GDRAAEGGEPGHHRAGARAQQQAGRAPARAWRRRHGAGSARTGLLAGREEHRLTVLPPAAHPHLTVCGRLSQPPWPPATPASPRPGTSSPPWRLLPTFLREFG